MFEEPIYFPQIEEYARSPSSVLQFRHRPENVLTGLSFRDHYSPFEPLGRKLRHLLAVLCPVARLPCRPRYKRHECPCGMGVRFSKSRKHHIGGKMRFECVTRNKR